MTDTSRFTVVPVARRRAYWIGGQHQAFGLSLGARVSGARMLVGADRRHMHQAGAMGARRQRHLLGAVGMNGVEALPPALVQQAYQIDQHAGVARRGFHRRRIAEIGLHRVDLADAAKRLQVESEVGPAHSHSDQVAAAGQRPHDMTAEEP